MHGLNKKKLLKSLTCCNYRSIVNVDNLPLHLISVSKGMPRLLLKQVQLNLLLMLAFLQIWLESDMISL